MDILVGNNFFNFCLIITVIFCSVQITVNASATRGGKPINQPTNHRRCRRMIDKLKSLF